MSRLPSWPVWLIVFGTVFFAAALATVLVVVGFRVDAFAELLRPGGVPSWVLIMSGLGLVGVLVFMVGLIAYVVRGSLSHESAERGYATIGTILACFGVATIIANVLTIPYGIVQAQQHPGESLTLTPGGLVLAVVTLEGSLLGVLFLRIVNPGVLSWRQMGVTAVDFWQRIRLGLGVGLAVIAASAVLEAALGAMGIHQTQGEMFAGVKGASLSQFLGVLLAGAVIAPLGEEIFFRGYVFTAVLRRYGLAPAFLTSSVLFALAHLNLEAFVPILLIGVTFCYVYWRTGSLVPSMIAHAMNNAVALAALYVYK